MPLDIYETLGEFGLKLGMHLLGKATEPEREVDIPKIANSIFDIAGKTAGEIVQKLELAEKINSEQFSSIAITIAREFKGLAELCLQIEISLKTATINIIENFEDELQSQRRKARHG